MARDELYAGHVQECNAVLLPPCPSGNNRVSDLKKVIIGLLLTGFSTSLYVVKTT